MNQENEVVYLPLDDIIPNRFQPREIFDEKALNELAASIKEHGVIQPIIVRQIGEKYEIIAGERRYKASAMAGLIKIPAIIRNLDDKESAKVALLENLQRKDLSPIEEARTYQKILELDEMTQEELAKTMGKSQSAVANKLRLLSLSEEVQDALLKEKISERHARALLNVQDQKQQVELLNQVIDSRMTVRELDQEIQKLNHSEEDPEGAEPEEVKLPPKFFNFDSIAPVPTVEPQPAVDPSMPSALGTPDLDELRANAKDINPEKAIADLDALLKLDEDQVEKDKVKEPVQEPLTPAPFKFVDAVDPMDDKDSIARLESLLKPPTVPATETEEKPQASVETLDFSLPNPTATEKPRAEEPTEDTIILNEPEKTQVPLPSQKLTPVVEAPKETYIYTMNQAINEVRDSVRLIERSGFMVDSEEMDLADEYRITIKIAKQTQDALE